MVSVSVRLGDEVILSEVDLRFTTGKAVLAVQRFLTDRSLFHGRSCRLVIIPMVLQMLNR